MIDSSSAVSSHAPLAIVGLSCLFPKAGSAKEFWSNIRQGVDAITEVPATHWRPEDYFDADPKSPDMTYARRGGFLSPVAFDPLEFGIAPSNLEAIDTSQLLSLVASKRALNDAGYGADGKPFDRQRVSCILGVTGTLELVVPLGARLGHPKWRQALKDAGVADDVAADVIQRISESYVPWQENSFPGLLGNVVAGRITNRLDLGGTNCVVDAACASSLSALHLAAAELWSGRSDMVLTGGVDTFNDIFMYMCFSKTPALSASGNSRPFADNADGTMLGEGVGILVLKRLADAQRDGDRIYALIRGIGSSSDGAGNAVYAPKKDGQIRCLEAAYQHAGVTPDTIELIEAHGTGTKVGDAIEVSALNDVFRRSGRTGRWCALGSVKSQIGHTKAAAGAAGLFKAVLALQHRVLPPTIKVDRPQDVLLADDAPLYINNQARPWIANPDYPRRAGVSAFGFGGSNFHCVLEEAPRPQITPDWDDEVLLAAFSGSSLAVLKQQLQQWPAPVSWTKARTLAMQARAAFRSGDEHRLVCVWERGKADVAASIQTALTLLDQYADRDQWSTPEGLWYARGERTGKLAVLFPGQGSQSVNMLRELACRFPVMQDVLADADAAFADCSESAATSRLSEAIYPVPAWNDDDRRAQEQRLRATEIAQPAIGAVSLGALAVLQQFGITAELTAGHSYGELTALCASHRFQPQALYRLSSLRGQLMAAAQEVDGGMLVVGAPLSQVEAAIAESAVDLVIANRNSPNQVVLSGRLPDIERAAELFSQRNLRGKRLPVSAAFHSPLVAAASQKFRPYLDDVEFAPSSMPVYANSSAELYPEEPAAARDLLAGQLAKPVEFVNQIENMYASGARCFLEVGPGNVLTGLVGAILSGRDIRTLSVDSSAGKRPGLTDLAYVLAQLSVAGYDLQLSNWDPEPPREPAATDRLTIPISGANYVKPREPRPPRVAASSAAQRIANPPASTATTVTSARSVTPSTQSNKPSMPLSPAVQTPAASPVTPAPGPANPALRTSAPRNTPTQAAESPQRTVSAAVGLPAHLSLLQKMQEDTARLHRQFLEGQELALRSLAALAGSTPAVERQQLAANTVVAPATPQPVRQTIAAGSPAAPSPAPAPLAVVPPAPRRSFATSQTPARSPSPAVAPAARTTPAPAPRNSAASSAATTPVARVESAVSDALSPQILTVVAEKTGYPVEMLKPSMSLDHDLGIDSIKRVEILSAVQERLPQLPTVTPEQLQTLHRLQDVLDLLGASAAQTNGVPTSGVQTNGPAVSPTQQAVVAPAAVSDLSPQILAVVAEKTGYPVEMLKPSMSLDHDLGIDSIKRVEILSAVQERLPQLPTVTPEQLQTLHRLQDVLDLLGAAGAVATNGLASAPIQQPPARSAAVSDLSPQILAVVAEKTGYPAEMLKPSMSLDHDLGIDSIKRVEILSAVQERLPELPTVTPEQLQTLHRLQDVLDLLGASAAALPQPEPVGTATPSARLATPDLSPRIMAVVAEKTGYPVEMLKPSMSLDHDLGIDSIKRVEILSAVQEQMPELPTVTPEQLQTLHRLQDVLDLLGGTTGVSPVAAATAPQTSQSGSSGQTAAAEDTAASGIESLTCGYLTAVEVAAEEERTPLPLPVGGEFWIIDDGSPLANSIASGLTSAGFAPHVLPWNAVETAVIDRPLCGLILVAPAGEVTQDHLWQSLAWVQFTGPTLKQTAESGGAAVLATISRLDGRFGCGATADFGDVTSAALAGLTKTVGHEWPTLSVKALDLAAELDIEAGAAAIVSEAIHEGPVECGLTAAGRIELQIQPVQHQVSRDVAAADLQLQRGDLVLVTGGARGVTAAAAVALARDWQPTLVLLGRSALPEAEPAWLSGVTEPTHIKQALATHGAASTPRELQQQCQQVLANREIQNTLQSLRNLGVTAEYRSVDVRDAAAIRSLLDDVQQKYGPVRGLVHGAGVLADHRIEDKTREQFDRVFSTKIFGLRNILQTIDPTALRALVMFSSFTARYGRTGQVDYAMANEILNKEAQLWQRQHPACRVVSFNWGPWDGGMVQGGLKSIFAREGVGLIPLSAGASLVSQALGRSTTAPVEMVVLGPDSRPLWSDQPTTADAPADSGTASLLLPADARLAFSREITVAQWPCLKSHVLGGKAVVPVALMLEWLGHAVIHRNPGLEFQGFDQLQVFQGVRLGATDTVALEVHVGKPRRVDGLFVVSASLVSRDRERLTRHAAADVVLAPTLLKAPAAKIDGGTTDSRTLNLPYQLLFHGPAFQGIQQVARCAREGLLVDSRTAAAPAEWSSAPLRSSWLADPLAIDVALQSLILWTRTYSGQPSLPALIAGYRQFRRSFPTDGVTVAVQIVSSSPLQIRANVEFRDADGQIVAVMSGVEHVLNSSLTAAFEQNVL